MEKINIKNYILPDDEESHLRNIGELIGYKALQEKNRGISPDYGMKKNSARAFVEYVCQKRVKIIRVIPNVHYIKNWKTYAYEQMDDTTLGKIFMTIMDEYDPNSYELGTEGDVFNFLDKSVEVTYDLKADDSYILFPNGIYNLKKHIFCNKVSVDAIFTYVMPFDYDKNAKCPNFIECINKMFDGDKERVSVIQEIFGYTFAFGEAPADVLPYFWGGGRNGKSVLGNVIRLLHGNENIAGVSLENLTERFQLAAIVDKRVCICPEAPQRKIFNSSMIKALTGGDVVAVERKYQDVISQEITCKIIVMSNHYFRATDSSTGLWKRILPIPFNTTFCSEKEMQEKGETKHLKLADPELEKKLQEELPGIFNWTMKGLLKLKKRNWIFSTSVECEKFKEKMIMYNCPLDVFVKRYVRRGTLENGQEKPDRIRTSDIHKKFIVWAEDMNLDVSELILPRKFHENFRGTLQAKGIPCEVRKNSVDYYYGIYLK